MTTLVQEVKNNVEELPQWALIALTALISVLLTAGAHFLIMGPQVMTRNEVEPKLQAIQQSINSIDRRLARIEGRQDRQDRNRRNSR